MEAHFWEVKDVLYIVAFLITIIGFYHRIETRVKESAQREALVEARLSALERLSEKSDDREEDRFKRVYERLDAIDKKFDTMTELLHRMDNRLSILEAVHQKDIDKLESKRWKATAD